MGEWLDLWSATNGHPLARKELGDLLDDRAQAVQVIRQLVNALEHYVGCGDRDAIESCFGCVARAAARPYLTEGDPRA